MRWFLKRKDPIKPFEHKPTGDFEQELVEKGSFNESSRTALNLFRRPKDEDLIARPIDADVIPELGHCFDCSTLPTLERSG